VRERPATLVDGHLIFEGGATRQLTKEERKQHEQGRLRTVKLGEARHPLVPYWPGTLRRA
jgi:hypothetical protein